MNQSITKIVTESIDLNNGTKIVLRQALHGVEMELHTSEGAFALPEEQVARIRSFGNVSFATTKAPTAVPKRSTTKRGAPALASAPATHTKSVSPSPVVVSATSDGSKQARRYSDEEKSTLLEGFHTAPNKSAFAKSNDIGIDTLRRWSKGSK